jgi:di/tricarboxylate transporter
MPLNHFISGVAATLLMTGVVFWRAKGAHESKVYFVVIAITAALVGFTGHLGGLMVYG